MQNSTRIRLRNTLVVAAVAFSAVNANAKLTAAEVERLGKDLTPVGAERAGNPQGSIPAWTGGMIKAPPGWNREEGYANPFEGEPPRFAITAQNMDQYREGLAPGVSALLKRNPNFRMPVYPTHRTAVFPKEVTDTARAQATQVEIQGFGVTNLGGSTVPFPIPRPAWKRFGIICCATPAVVLNVPDIPFRCGQMVILIGSVFMRFAFTIKTWINKRRIVCIARWVRLSSRPV